MENTQALKDMIERQRAEIASLKRSLSLQREGHRELSRTVDAICIAVAVKFGARVGQDTREAILPDIRVDELTERYRLQAEKVSPRRYTIRAVMTDGGAQ